MARCFASCGMVVATCVLVGLHGADPARAADWTPITPPDSPAARHGHSMVVLPEGRVMLFGGADEQGNFFNDLHAFDGNSWAPVTPASDPPLPRESHAAMWHRNKMYISGGLGRDSFLVHPKFLDDLEVFNVEEMSWLELFADGTTPPARASHGFFATDAGGLCVVGGYDGEQRSDLWCLYGGAWVRKADAPVGFHNRGVVSWRNVLLVLGLSAAPTPNGATANGAAGGAGTVLAWDSTVDTWSWVPLGGGPESWPAARAGAAWAQRHNKVWMIGGYVPGQAGASGATTAGDAGWSLQTWELDLDTLVWSRQPDMPELRTFPEAAYSELMGQVIVFGGGDAAGNLRNDTFAFTPNDDRPRRRVRRAIRRSGQP